MLGHKKNIVIVGGNAAGPAAAAKAKRVAPDANVLLFEAGKYISTGTCELPYVLSGEIENYKGIVFYDSDSFYEEKNVKVYTKHLVQSIDKRYKTISVKNLKDDTTFEINYDKLVLTTGSKAKKLNGLDDSLENVFYLKSVENLIKIQNYIKNKFPKNVLIVGAGYIGIESAEAFRNLGSTVTILEKEKSPMPGASQEVANLIQNNLFNNKINFLGNAPHTKFLTSDNKFVAINYDNRIIEFDLILVASGISPNNNLAISSRLDIGNSGAIKVDNKQKSSDQNIFAAGDNCEIENRITRKKEYFPLATMAHKFGHIAGANAAGANLFSEPIVKNIAVKIFDDVYTKVGISESEALENRFNIIKVNSVNNNLVKVMPGSRKSFGQIIFDRYSGMILGGEFFGGSEVIGYADIISSMIFNKNKAENLSNIDFNYTPPLSPFVNLLSVLGRKIKRSM